MYRQEILLLDQVELVDAADPEVSENQSACFDLPFAALFDNRYCESCLCRPDAVSEHRSRRELADEPEHRTLPTTRLANDQEMTLAADSSVTFELRDPSNYREEEGKFDIVLLVEMRANRFDNSRAILKSVRAVLPRACDRVGRRWLLRLAPL